MTAGEGIDFGEVVVTGVVVASSGAADVTEEESSPTDEVVDATTLVSSLAVLGVIANPAEIQAARKSEVVKKVEGFSLASSLRSRK